MKEFHAWMDANALVVGVVAAAAALWLWHHFGPRGTAPSTSVVPELPPGSGWYFAYGSNMSPVQCQVRVGPRSPDAVLRLRLPNHSLCFNVASAAQEGIGYANVVPVTSGAGSGSGEQHVYGVGYAFTAAQQRKMDGFEGHPTMYRREELQCEVYECGGSDGKTVRVVGTVPAFVYVATGDATAPGLLPSAQYLGRLVEGCPLLPPHAAEALTGQETSRHRSPRQDRRERGEL